MKLTVKMGNNVQLKEPTFNKEKLKKPIYNKKELNDQLVTDIKLKKQ